jgi:pentatricopeptide repeat protein
MVGNHAISIVYGYILSAVTALAFHFVQAPYQWRLQFVLLTFFGLVLLASVVSLPESPRWLCEQGRYDEAWEVLKKLHQQADISDTTFATTEMSQIKAQIQAERSMPRGYMHIVRTPQLRHRAACSILVWIMGQSTGVLVIANLTAVIFGQLGFSVTLQLGLSVVWAVCALLGCFVNAALMDGIGRIKLLGGDFALCHSFLFLLLIVLPSHRVWRVPL